MVLSLDAACERMRGIRTGEHSRGDMVPGPRDTPCSVLSSSSQDTNNNNNPSVLPQTPCRASQSGLWRRKRMRSGWVGSVCCTGSTGLRQPIDFAHAWSHDLRAAPRTSCMQECTRRQGMGGASRSDSGRRAVVPAVVERVVIAAQTVPCGREEKQVSIEIGCDDVIWSVAGEKHVHSKQKATRFQRLLRDYPLVNPPSDDDRQSVR